MTVRGSSAHTYLIEKGFSENKNLYLVSSIEDMTKLLINKKVDSVQEALQGVQDNMTFMFGGFGLSGIAENSIAELVKIDAKSIGVGQYQHDVNQIKLAQSLDAVLEDCVNTVGADVNTASVPLLKSIAGLNETLAKNIVSYRESTGRFKNRKEL